METTIIGEKEEISYGHYNSRKPKRYWQLFTETVDYSRKELQIHGLEKIVALEAQRRAWLLLQELAYKASHHVHIG